MQATGRRLQVAGYRSQATGRRLQVANVGCDLRPATCANPGQPCALRLASCDLSSKLRQHPHIRALDIVPHRLDMGCIGAERVVQQRQHGCLLVAGGGGLDRQ
jgi:hypothetical protein